MQAIEVRMEVIAIRLETIDYRFEAIAIRLEAIAIRLEAVAVRLKAINRINIRLDAIATVLGWRPSLFKGLCLTAGRRPTRVCVGLGRVHVKLSGAYWALGWAKLGPCGLCWAHLGPMLA